MNRAAPVLAWALIAAPLLAGAVIAAPGHARAQDAEEPRAVVAPVRKPPAAAKPAPVSAGPQRFSRWIEDLPVMPGLYETDGGYAFEVSKGGRLAEARLHGVVDPQVVRGFYAATLPALGWKAQTGAPYAYRRGRERLLLHVTPAKPRGILAVFVLTPEPGSDAASSAVSTREPS
jgi:hypothetical protein